MNKPNIGEVAELVQSIASLAEKTARLTKATEKNTSATETAKPVLAGFDRLNNLVFTQMKNAVRSANAGRSASSSSARGKNTAPLLSLPKIAFPELNLKGFKLDLGEEFKKGFDYSADMGKAQSALKHIKRNISGIGNAISDIFGDVQSNFDSLLKSVQRNAGKVTGAFYSAMASVGDFLTGSVAGWLRKDREYISQSINGIFEASQRALNGIGELAASVGYVFTALQTKAAKAFGAELLGIFANTALGIGNIFSKLGADIVNLIAEPIIANREILKETIENALSVGVERLAVVNEGIKELFTAMAAIYDSTVTPAFENFASGSADILRTLCEVINGEVLPAYQAFTDFIERHFSVIISLGEKIAQNTANIFYDLSRIFAIDGTALGATLGGMLTTLEKIGEAVSGAVLTGLEVALSVIEKISYALSLVSGAVRELAENSHSFGENFETALDGIKKKGAELESFFKGLFSTLKNAFTLAGTNMGESLAAALKLTVNSALAAIQGALDIMYGGINSLAATVTQLTGINVPKINAVKIPMLAQGGIISAPTLAMVGERGKEAVIPLEGEGLREIVQMLKGTEGDKPLTIEINIGGRHFARACVRSINELSRSMGKCVIEV